MQKWVLLALLLRMGPVLPRVSGDRQEPMTDNFIPFESPDDLLYTFNLPYEYNKMNEITGMLLPRGIHLITEWRLPRQKYPSTSLSSGSLLQYLLAMAVSLVITQK